MKKYPHGLTLNAVCAAIDDYQRHEDSVPEEGILAAFNTLLGHSDIADALRSMERTADVNMAAAQAMRDDMYHWKQRAESAEAKLAELEKQEPVADVVPWNHPNEERTCDVWLRKFDLKPGELFYRPAPAADLAELVPSVCDGKEQEAFEAYARQKGLDLSRHPLHYLFLDGKTNQARSAWRECLVYVRSAILRNIEEAK